MKTRLKQNFLDELKKTPIVAVACQNTGISRQTLYRWINNDPKFKEKFYLAMNDGVSNVNDIAESKLLKKIQNDDFKAIKYWLDHHHPKYMKNINYDKLLNNLNLIKQANKNISLDDALKIAEDNLKESVQMGNIKDSKYLLEKRNPEYSRTRIENRGNFSNQESLIAQEEEIDKMVETLKKFLPKELLDYFDKGIIPKPLSDEEINTQSDLDISETL